MNIDFIGIANAYIDMARIELENGRAAEAYALIEMAFTAAFMPKCATPLSCKLVPRQQLPRPLASVDHILVQLSRHGLILWADREIVKRPLCDFRRFPMVGDFFSRLAQRAPDSGMFECFVDIGDGDDVGDYPRVAYSSARPDAVLMPDPLFYINENYALHRAFVTERAKPWRDRADVIFWRGGAGGPRIPGAAGAWDWQQRLHLCETARNSAHADKLDVALSNYRAIGQAALRNAIDAAGFLDREVPKIRFLDYRYLIDVDGWTNAWSLLDKMIGGATMLKVDSAFGYRQWYYDKLKPFENYLPIAADLSDFDAIVGWALAHPAECEEIGAQAAATAETIQLEPDLAAAETAVAAILTPAQQPQNAESLSST